MKIINNYLVSSCGECDYKEVAYEMPHVYLCEKTTKVSVHTNPEVIHRDCPLADCEVILEENWISGADAILVETAPCEIAQIIIVKKQRMVK